MHSIAYKSHSKALKSHKISFKSHTIAYDKVVKDIPEITVRITSNKNEITYCWCFTCGYTKADDKSMGKEYRNMLGYYKTHSFDDQILSLDF